MTIEDKTITGEIEFAFNPRKSVEAVLYIIDKMGGEIDQYKLLKVIFSADKYHLNNNARIVTGDLYVKMQYGTVPSSLYEIVSGKKTSSYLKDMELEELPFMISPGKDNNTVSASQKPDTDYLSQTDIVALDYGIQEYGHLSFDEIKKKNHQEKCWQDTPDGKFIPFELMIENTEILDDLLEHPYGIVV